MSPERKQRRDAQANRERILAAAQDAFHRHGLSVDMRAVAAAAEVGIGTLYRHYPTREDLVRAVTGTDLAGLTTFPAQCSAIDGLREFFTSALKQLLANKAALDLLASGTPDDTELQRCLDHLRSIGAQAIERSATDNTLTPDVTANGIAYQLLGLIRIAPLIAEPAAISHQVELALRGLAAR